MDRPDVEGMKDRADRNWSHVDAGVLARYVLHLEARAAEREQRMHDCVECAWDAVAARYGTPSGRWAAESAAEMAERMLAIYRGDLAEREAAREQRVEASRESSAKGVQAMLEQAQEMSRIDWVAGAVILITSRGNYCVLTDGSEDKRIAWLTQDCMDALTQMGEASCDEKPDIPSIKKNAWPVVAYDGPRPLSRTLEVLADAAEHLLDRHDCDTHGHENVRRCIDSARHYVTLVTEGVDDATKV